MGTKKLTLSKSTTPFEEASLKTFVKQARRTLLLSSEEELLLVQKVKSGDRNALEKLVTANLRFVVAVAKHYQNQGLSLPDLVGFGCAGLVVGIDKFDETRGLKLISYAVWHIREQIRKALCKNSRTIRLPKEKITFLGDVEKFSRDFEQKHERLPILEEILDRFFNETDDIEDYKELLITNYRAVSLESSVDDGETTLEGVLSGDATPAEYQLPPEIDLRKEWERISSVVLIGNQGKVLSLYYGIGGEPRITLMKIAKKLNLSAERIRQVRDEGLAKLRKNPAELKTFQEFFAG